MKLRCPHTPRPLAVYSTADRAARGGRGGRGRGRGRGSVRVRDERERQVRWKTSPHSLLAHTPNMCRALRAQVPSASKLHTLRERADRRTGTSLPSSARVRQATCPSNVALVGNQDRAGPPGLSLVTTKTIPTYRTRGPRREAAPTPPPGRWPACTSRGWPDTLQKQVRPGGLIRKCVPQ